MGYGNVSERRFAPPQIGVTSVILALESETHGHARRRLWLPLVQRTREPFKGMWALPGGRLQANRSLEESAFATLASTTDLHPTYLEQLYTFGDPMRSSNGIPMVSVCYWALLDHADLGTEPGTAGNAHNVRWFPVDDLPELAFDHTTIVEYALWRLRHRMDAPNVVRQLIADPFTLGQLHDVVEAVLGEEIDLANFRRKMLASHTLEDTGEVAREGRRRPAALYHFADHAEEEGFAFFAEHVAGNPHGACEALQVNTPDDALSALMPHA